jgi:actin-like ATPase involved in cell morphogenesis
VSSWTLGIDFGTTFTVAAVAQEGSIRPVDFETDGSYRMASAVLLDDVGNLAVGQSAVHQSIFHPDRFERTPKRMVGEGDLILGDRMVPVTVAVAAVLERAKAEGIREAGSPGPHRTVLTHPADWGSTRLDVLRQAAEAAELNHVELVPEPVAAAIELGARVLHPDQHVAVYDFGGGTFDVAVLRRTADGFEVAGPPGGRDPLGGEDIDQRIVDHLARGPVGEHPDWPKLLDPPDVQWGRHAAALRTEVRRAKEGLSTQTVWQMWVPGIERDVQLSRTDLEKLIHDDVEATVDTTIETIKAAGLEPSELAGIYLVGGSSKIPLVAARLWSRTGIRPSVQGDPKTVVALGASGWRQPKPTVTKVLPDRTFQSDLAMATRAFFWNGVAYCYGYLTVTPDGEAGSATFSDEPATGSLDQVVQAAGERWSNRPGYRELSVEKVDWLGHHGVERWFATEEPSGSEWVERYIVVGDRSIVGLAPAALASRLDAVTYRKQTLEADRFYQLPLSSDLAPGDRVHERVELIRAGSDQRVTAESYELDPEWGESRIAAYQSHPGYTSLTRTTTRMLGQSDKTWMLGMADGVPGQMHSFWSSSASESTKPLQTRIWIGQAEGRTYSLVATLPTNQKINFKFLFAHATLAKADAVPPNRKW